MVDLNYRYRYLVQRLIFVAGDLEDQKEALPEFAQYNVIVEVIDEFWHAFILTPALLENGRLSVEGIAAVIRCYVAMEMARMDFVESDDLEKNMEVFQSGESWKRVRMLAHEALKILGEPYQKLYSDSW